MKSITLSVIIPVYNEEKTVEELLRKVVNTELEPIKKEVIVVEDGSFDATPSLLENLKKSLPFLLITHRKNAGKGSALIAGIKRVTGSFFIIQDADLEYEPNDYKKLLDYAIKNNAKVVYGSRNLKEKNKRGVFSFYWGGVFLTWLTNVLYGTKLTDITTGYKLFETKLIKSIPLTSKRFEFCAEITAKIANRGILIYEVPIHYYPRSVDEGKKLKRKDGLGHLWTLIKYKFVE